MWAIQGFGTQQFNAGGTEVLMACPVRRALAAASMPTITMLPAQRYPTMLVAETL
jgi:hypothetical protein